MKIIKKISLAIIIISAFYFLFHASFASAIADTPRQLGPKCDPTGQGRDNLPPCDLKAFLDWIRQVIEFLLIIAIPLGVIFIVYGGFVIMTAGGSEERVKKGRGVITAAVIGLVIALASWLIVTTIKKVLEGFF